MLRFFHSSAAILFPRKAVSPKTAKTKTKATGKASKIPYEQSIPSRYKLLPFKESSDEPIQESFNTTPALMNALESLKIKRPSEIQKRGISAILEHPTVLLAAQTGTGKTLAYLLPLFQKLKEEEKSQPRIAKSPRAVILVPTRELVMQVHQTAKVLSKFEKLKVEWILQGMDHKDFQSKLNGPVDILVTVPYRFLSLMQSNAISKHSLKHIVIDEADTLLSKDFATQTLEIYDTVKTQLQSTILASATISKSIDTAITSSFPDIFKIFAKSCHKPSMHVSQTFRPVKEGGHGKKNLCISIIDQSPTSNYIIFGNTKGSIAQLHEYMVEKYPTAQILHRDLPDKSRSKVIELYKASAFNILLTTDLVSRGVDTLNVDHVILYDFPQNYLDYLHRIGRTGRAFGFGKVTALYTQSEKPFVQYVKKLYDAERRKHRELLNPNKTSSSRTLAVKRKRKPLATKKP